MIIDTNGQNNFKNSSFDNNWQQVKNNSNVKTNNVFTKNITEMQHTNPSNTQDMNERALAVLEQRYQNKNININDFHKKCDQLNKK